MRPPRIVRAVSASTVIPGQLATLACTPVSRLNTVDLPVLGMPTTATRRRVGAAVRGAAPITPLWMPALLATASCGCRRLPKRKPGRFMRRPLRCA
ncbi:MAG: hypothetical protein ACK6C0_14790, partial [Betaproteobacteria bacterium]